MDGWSGTTAGARSWADLPAQAIKYVRRIEVSPHGLCERQDEVGNLGQVVPQSLAVDRRLAKTSAERVVVRAKAVE